MAQKIEIVRGTTNVIQIEVTDAAGQPRTLSSGETILFGIKQNPMDDHLLFVQAAVTADVGIFTVEIAPSNTEDLDPGRYYYDVGLQSGEDFFNIVECNVFNILPNITKRGATV